MRCSMSVLKDQRFDRIKGTSGTTIGRSFRESSASFPEYHASMNGPPKNSGPCIPCEYFLKNGRGYSLSALRNQKFDPEGGTSGTTACHSLRPHYRFMPTGRLLGLRNFKTPTISRVHQVPPWPAQTVLAHCGEVCSWRDGTFDKKCRINTMSSDRYTPQRPTDPNHLRIPHRIPVVMNDNDIAYGAGCGVI